MPKLYYKFTQLWCLVCSSKRSIYLPMENYGLQTCIFLFCHSFFVSFSFFSFVNYELKIGFKAQFLKFQVFYISSAKQKYFFDQSTIKRLGKLKLLSYYEVQVNNYEIVVKIFHISHNLTWYSAIVHKFTRIYPVCSTYDVTKQFM